MEPIVEEFRANIWQALKRSCISEKRLVWEITILCIYIYIYIYVCVCVIRISSRHSGGGKGQRREEMKREDQRRERVRRQKMQAREKGSKAAKHCVFPMICGSGGSKSRLAKAAGAEPSGEMRNEKLHAVVARSTSPSQNVQNTPGSEHFWKLRCRKSARCCGANHISKSKVLTLLTTYSPIVNSPRRIQNLAFSWGGLPGKVAPTCVYLLWISCFFCHAWLIHVTFKQIQSRVYMSPCRRWCLSRVVASIHLITVDAGLQLGCCRADAKWLRC